MDKLAQLINAMNALTQAVQGLTEKVTAEYLNTFEEIYNPEKDAPQTEQQPAPVPTFDRPTVKAKLAELMKQGLSAEVKELLQSHGAQRFSEIQDEELPALMKEAEAIGT